jgi:hypothetical protein
LPASRAISFASSPRLRMCAVMHARSHALLHNYTPCPYIFLAVAPLSATTTMLSSVAHDVVAMSSFNCYSDGDAMPLRQHLTPAFPRSVGFGPVFFPPSGALVVGT